MSKSKKKIEKHEIDSKQVRVSEAVWNEIGRRAKFRESADSVLRRVFALPPKQRYTEKESA